MHKMQNLKEKAAPPPASTRGTWGLMMEAAVMPAVPGALRVPDPLTVHLEGGLQAPQTQAPSREQGRLCWEAPSPHLLFLLGFFLFFQQ